MKVYRLIGLAALGCIGWLGWLGAAQAQTLRQDAPLFDKPDGAAVGAPLKTGAAVKMLKRQGFWVEVDAGGKTGWLKASLLNFGGATGGATAIDTGRLGTGNIVSTSSARGLSSKDLLSGKPNMEEAAKLDLLVLDSAAVSAFMGQGNVKPISEKVALVAVRSAAPAAGSVSNSGSGTGAAVSGSKPAGAAPQKKADDDW